MKITSREHVGEAEVFDIGLPDIHNFILENGTVASNCFNKAHSVSYSMLTYISAYLKANYPSEFFCALMTVRSKSLQPKTWATKAPEYIQEAHAFGIEIHPPSINSSNLGFSIRDEDVYFGLNAIRDVGKTAARTIVRARGKAPYKSVLDFLQRVNLQKVTTKTFISLVKAGAFDMLGYDRTDLIQNSQTLYDYIRDVVDYEQRKIDLVVRKKEIEDLTIVIDKRNVLRKELKKIEKELKKVEDKTLLLRKLEVEEELFPLEQMNLRRKPRLKPKQEPQKPEPARSKEVEINIHQIMEQAHYIGCYIGTHPAQLVNSGAVKLKNLYKGQRTYVCGVINSLKVIRTRKGHEMAFCEIDDSTSTAEVTIFPKTWRNAKLNNISENKLVRMKIKTEQEEPVIKLIADSIVVYQENIDEMA